MGAAAAGKLPALSEGLFAGRVAVVTGGSGGIGAAICAALVGNGALVASVARTDSASATINVRCDVTKEEDVASAVREVEDRLGRITLLVCSAGVVTESPVTELPLAEWRRVLDVSLTGTFLACRAVVPSMRSAGGGSIVALSSGYATKGYARGSHYAAAKAGVEAFVKSLALEVAAEGITVNAIAPGPIETSMLEHVRAEPGRWERTIGLIPQRRIGEAGDVVGPVLFLLSPAARYVTGQVVHVNGGMVMP